ncbi:zinc finger protein ubi-d4-like isoform X2 [Daphnia carinata]|uniref:zinc finger protein ubi-d4-like isoform X2 n=1 Tax=Daphnia carinata TaxID=120202 RepID=UPI00257EB669|nr:zinc finger protein ubi-d4-like isoform X2 [Daphnia carinata]
MGVMAASGIVVNRPIVEKLQNLLQDSTYRDAVENSASFNTRMALEKRMRLPFLDAQTGVAQNHCHLWMHPRHRMPGLTPDQVYTYPAKRWRKKRRSYLVTYAQSPKKKEIAPPPEAEAEAPAIAEPLMSTVIQPINEDSKDSTTHAVLSNKDEASKEGWYFDELQPEQDDFEEPDADSDFDYEESNKKKKKKAMMKTPAKTPSTRGRKKQIPMNYDATDTEKPYSCERRSRSSRHGAMQQPPTGLAPTMQSDTPKRINPPHPQAPVNTQFNTISGSIAAGIAVPPVTATGSNVYTGPVAAPAVREMEMKARAPPSPYCDFCLGDATENKKSGHPEELVSCADCGRSGHPSCLQFTANMIISVKQYRWQCIECKCCSLCGNSDNDEQLLFCDDCDRGYHMYCLKPPLSEPPEGSWSCHLCLVSFHRK